MEDSEVSGEGTPTKTIGELIESGDYKKAEDLCRRHPEAVRHVDDLTGVTILHLLCRKPPTPMSLFQTVLDIFPPAVRVQENTFKATPLHILAWTSQRTSRKVKLLLEYMDAEDLKLRNLFGGTSLHSACGSQASIDVIKLIYEKNPSITALRTHEYNHTALTALWHSHLQSIQGHMQIARILEGKEVTEGHFDRFWEKVEFLARETFKLSDSAPADLDESTFDYALHGLMQLRAPLNALKVAVKRHPEWASIPDKNGNYPLHTLVAERPFRVKDIELIKEFITAYRDAARHRNDAGDTPVFIGIRGRMAWEEGLREIANASTDVMALVDLQTGLYPFLLAASISGQVAVNTTYNLLCVKPYLVKDAIG